MSNNSIPGLDVVYKRLRDYALRESIEVVLHTGHIRMENGWLKLPASIQNTENAYDKAMALQTLEDSWNNQEPRPKLHVILMSAADNSARHAA